MSKDIVIEVKNLSKCYHIYEKPGDRLKQMLFRGRKKLYREFWAVKDVSFEIKKGETVGVVGQNGSGKSTLLQLICGTLNPTSGSINVNGRVSALLELGSGFNPEFTGKENVYLNASILGLSKEEIDGRYNEILAFADIGDFIDQPVKTYSSGMLMRLAFSVAINVDPDILVVDEALAVGDELFQRKCFSRIEIMKSRGVTILFVSHSSSMVVELCDKAVLMDLGEIIAIDKSKIIVGEYQKLTYASIHKRNSIRNQIKSSLFSNESDLSVMFQDLIESKVSSDVQFELSEKGSFDDSLTTRSAIEYESKGARIEHATVFGLNGSPINCLIHGGRYKYVYKVKFEKDSYGVSFGMMIKTTSGIEIGGWTTSKNSTNRIFFQPANTVLVVEFEFLCSLNPGVYFLNAGVVGMVDQNDTYLHRILDVVMIKVLPLEGNLSTGIVDFNCTFNFSVVGYS